MTATRRRSRVQLPQPPPGGPTPSPPRLPPLRALSLAAICAPLAAALAAAALGFFLFSGGAGVVTRLKGAAGYLLLAVAPGSATLVAAVVVAAAALAATAAAATSARLRAVASAAMAAMIVPLVDASRYRHLRNALLLARVAPVAGSESGSSLVTLPSDVEWPQLGATPLFVRSFYAGCFEGVLKSCAPGDGVRTLRKFAIVGNAGIGKSAFGAYLLMRLVQAHQTVVYVSNKAHEAFILHGDGRVEAFISSDFLRHASSVLNDRSTVLIYEGDDVPFCNAFTVLISPPKRERYHEFLKAKGSRRLTFPVFSPAEVTDMLRTCDADLLEAGAPAGGEAGVWVRYSIVGGIPRLLFDTIDDDMMSLLASAAKKTSLSRIIDIFATGNVEPEGDLISHRLLHFKAAGESVLVNAAGDRVDSFVNAHDVESYRLVRCEPASPFVLATLCADADRAGASSLRELLAHGTDRYAGLGVLTGRLIERYALAKLVAGGTIWRNPGLPN